MPIAQPNQADVVPTCQCDAGSALYVVVEAAVGACVLFQQLEGVVVGKVLKLDQRVGLPPLQG